MLLASKGHQLGAHKSKIFPWCLRNTPLSEVTVLWLRLWTIKWILSDRNEEFLLAPSEFKMLGKNIPNSLHCWHNRCCSQWHSIFCNPVSTCRIWNASLHFQTSKSSYLWQGSTKARKRTFPRIPYTLISVTGSGHIKYKKRHLHYKVKDKTSCQSNLLRYMATGHIFYK